MTSLDPKGLRGPLSTGVVFLAMMFLYPITSLSQDQSNPQTSTSPDNSAKNKAHSDTADQQSENSSDRMITKKIRQSVIADKSLSTYAHNVKIITQNGFVTLKGPVSSEEEKQNIASKAAEVVGSADKVDDRLTVKK
jgi:hyperosmotically inducible protein